MYLILLLIVPVLLFLIALFSKTVKYEIWYNIMGARAMLEDLIYRSSNKFQAEPRDGCVAVITGGARGIGVEVVKRLIECNISVVIACRDVNAGKALIKKISDTNSNVPKIKVYQLDLGSLDSVRKFSKQVTNDYPKINFLVNNAGIMFGPYRETVEGFESQFGVNYLGHFLLTQLLLPNLRKAAKESHYTSRIVNVSSCAHLLGDMEFNDLMMKKDFITSAAYSRSKLAQVMFTKYLNKLCKQEKVKIESFAVHPGIVDTDLFNGTLLKTFAPWMPLLFFKNPAQGSCTIAHACISKTLEGEGGAYLSNCRIVTDNPLASDEKLQKQLIEHSKKLCGI